MKTSTLQQGGKVTKRVIIGGDVCPINENESICIQADDHAAFGELRFDMQDCDFCVVNLECPLIEKPSPIEKIGPVIGATRETVRILPSAGIDAVGLANNHIMDHGNSGLSSTISACEEHGVAYFGAGPDLKAAQKVLIRDLQGLRVGFLAVSHHEFSIADEVSPGAAPMAPIEVYSQLSKQADWDVLVALVHAGPANYPLPTPALQKYCRFLVDLGASAVICQHSHCVGTFENYKNALIVYGQGNFLFDWLPEPGPAWFKGFLVDLELAKEGIVSYRFLPYKRGQAGFGVEPLGEIEAADFITKIEDTSRALSSPAELNRSWLKYCEKRENAYYQQLFGNLPGTNLLRRLADRLGIRIVPLRRQHRITLLNLVRCEAHREALETILNQD